MECKKCGTKNSPALNFCENCGHKFPFHCRECGAIDGISGNFCENCGSRIKINESKSVNPPNDVDLKCANNTNENFEQNLENYKPSTSNSEIPDSSTNIEINQKPNRDESQLGDVPPSAPTHERYNIPTDAFELTGDNRCYTKGNIPIAQLTNAINEFAPGVEPSDVLVFADNTFTRNGKVGFILTSDAFYCKNDYGDPISIRLSEVKDISIKKGFIKNFIVINGVDVFMLGLISIKTAECLVSSIKKATLL